MTGKRYKYPRTPHLPWSPGVMSDDVRAGTAEWFEGREVVVTEKLDGENTTLYCDGMHARSLDSGHHPSRSRVKALQAQVGPYIPEDWRVCGENVYARHSVAYSELGGYFYGFSVWDREVCLSWDETEAFLRFLGVPVPPVLWRGAFSEKEARELKVDEERQEGYVVRLAGRFTLAEFPCSVAKWVRAGHVQAGGHWAMAAVVPNLLSPKG